MRITYLQINNYKSIENLTIEDIEDVMILVGRNNCGKSIIMDAVRAALGQCAINDMDFHGKEGNISILIKLAIEENDLTYLHRNAIVSNMKNYDLWLNEFKERVPSYRDGILSFEFIYGRDGIKRYKDGYSKNNPYIPEVLPKIYYVDHLRRNLSIRDDMLMLLGDNGFSKVRKNSCIFDDNKKCNLCFECIGLINKKKPTELTVLEAGRLLQYKLFNINLNAFAEKLNEAFSKNGAKSEKITYEMELDLENLFTVNTVVTDKGRNIEGNIESLGEGLKSIYILSLLETYVDLENVVPYIIMIEEPEMFLHPKLQKVASEILYRLSKKNQVIFTTHLPEMLYNFNSRQIVQVYTDRNYNTVAKPEADVDEILDDLGYGANDLMNVSFVFIVEGKQDRSRLPLLLSKYYSEVVDENGDLKRIAIISTNSCTNIKTYANLKYMNTLYLKDNFMMIRDSDGKDRDMLGKQLCRYYGDRAREDYGNLPRVSDRNVLILKYYSFENYFLNPEVMAKIGVVKSEEQFYDILYRKWKEYLYKLSSVRRMEEKLGIKIETKEDIKNNIENIRIYVRGHNLYDIFYGKYKDNEKEILTKYIDEAPREVFEDILEKIDRFVFFDSKKKQEGEKNE